MAEMKEERVDVVILEQKREGSGSQQDKRCFLA